MSAWQSRSFLATNIFILTNIFVYNRNDSMQGDTIEMIQQDSQAIALLHPLRRRILEALRQPDSAAGLARRLHLPRQKVNYHVRELARARFLERAGRRRRRNMFEQRYVTRARGYVLSPELLGYVRADRAQAEDAFSAAYLLALSTQLQSELGRAVSEARQQGKRIATLSLCSSLRFESAAQRATFTSELQRAVTGVVARFSSPYLAADGSPAHGRPYRLMLGCYPIPPSDENSESHTPTSESESQS
jgi:DNA-binding transcriptional ArsR family regulator